MSKPRTRLNTALLTITLGCTSTQAKLVADEIDRLESENESLTEKAGRLREMVGFLASCCRSGESLSAKDEADIKQALETEAK